MACDDRAVGRPPRRTPRSASADDSDLSHRARFGVRVNHHQFGDTVAGSDRGEAVFAPGEGAKVGAVGGDLAPLVGADVPRVDLVPTRFLRSKQHPGAVGRPHRRIVVDAIGPWEFADAASFGVNNDDAARVQIIAGGSHRRDGRRTWPSGDLLEVAINVGHRA